MKLVSPVKGVDVRRETREGMHGIVQFMKCSECEKELRIASSHSGGTLPPEPIFKTARHNGWLPKKNGKHICPSCQKGDEVDTDAPREMTAKDRRLIFREIDECYDDVNSRYVDNYTDATIATKLGMPRKWVEDIREENFGPSGVNTEMDRVASALGKINAELTDAINDCMEAAAKAEKLKERVEAARGDLDKIKAAVGPHRASA